MDLFRWFKPKHGRVSFDAFGFTYQEDVKLLPYGEKYVEFVGVRYFLDAESKTLNTIDGEIYKKFLWDVKPR